MIDQEALGPCHKLLEILLEEEKTAIIGGKVLSLFSTIISCSFYLYGYKFPNKLALMGIIKLFAKNKKIFLRPNCKL